MRNMLPLAYTLNHELPKGGNTKYFSSKGSFSKTTF